MTQFLSILYDSSSESYLLLSCMLQNIAEKIEPLIKHTHTKKSRLTMHLSSFSMAIFNFECQLLQKLQSSSQFHGENIAVRTAKW